MRDKEKIFSLLRESVQSRREANIVEEFIDKMERRMAPIEIIDDNHCKFNGLTYYKDERTGRYFSRMSLSRVVWTYFNGEIPEGYEIHHVDENKSNDDITNLQMMTKSEHWKIHGKNFGKVKTKKTAKFICIACGKEYESTNTGNNRYCSKKCRESYRRNMYQATFTCIFCGKEFSAYKYSKSRVRKFCSQKCAHEYAKTRKSSN